MHPRLILSVGHFFIVMSMTLVNYILLSYLSMFMPDTYAGLIIVVGAIISMIGFPYLPQVVARFGAQRISIFFAFAQMILLFALAATPGLISGTLFTVFTLAAQPFLFYGLDLLLEATVDGGMSGRVRTAFLTAGNMGAFTAPLLLSVLLDGTNTYSYVFFAAAVALVPLLVLLAARKLPKGEEPKPTHLRDTLACISRERDLAAVTFGHLLLYLFYSWAPLYVPIYLHSTLGIPWSTLGWIFSLMLLPYILVEYPAGWFADRVVGDKKLMVAGFLITGLSFASIGLITSATSTLVILLVLVATRVGAALIESMTEGHFFRRISKQDISSMSIFRGVWPAANIAAPIVGSLILYFGDFQIFFLLTGGFIVLTGTIAALMTRDSRQYTENPIDGGVCLPN